MTVRIRPLSLSAITMLPAGWPVLVDAAVANAPYVVIGSGVRHSKLVLPAKLLAGLPGARVIDGLAR